MLMKNVDRYFPRTFEHLLIGINILAMNKLLHLKMKLEKWEMINMYKICYKGIIENMTNKDDKARRQKCNSTDISGGGE
ncbi:hypothetical protein [Bacillus seohaeanensis]|jgi:hypothetical protein|uniref:Uncharacterized protein n=1 Tax=Bacillus seohaeanensis TaxID=284580 RepID=A0ABW5RWS8_9BACI